MSQAEKAARILVGYVRPLAFALLRPRFAWAAMRLVAEAIRSFFGPQYVNALLHQRPVVNVDHPLDGSVPFDPSYVKKYLEFIVLWMSSFYTLARTYGPDAYPLLADYVDDIRRLYAEAGSVYTTIHSTTTRPAENYNLRFAIIHATDPHLNCVPSLHVLIVVANWKLASSVVERMRERGRRLNPRAEQRLDAWLEALRDEALAISESILFVKQHSINCIGASLFYLRRSGPRMGDGELRELVRDLFCERSRAILGQRAVEELGACAIELYERLDAQLAARPELGWKGTLLAFLEGYAQLSGRSVSSIVESSSEVSSG